MYTTEFHRHFAPQKPADTIGADTAKNPGTPYWFWKKERYISVWKKYKQV
jgi:hypothetical protein